MSIPIVHNESYYLGNDNDGMMVIVHITPLINTLQGTNLFWTHKDMNYHPLHYNTYRSFTKHEISILRSIIM